MDPEPKYLPLFCNIMGRACLVVGGGEVACRKVEQLRAADARVTVIAPQVVPCLANLIRTGKCHWFERPYQSPESEDYRLVIAATDDHAVNEQVHRDCEERGVLVNVVDQPHLCTVIFPAVVRRGPATLALSTAGAAPFLTRHLRERLEGFLSSIPFLEKPKLLIHFRNLIRTRGLDSDKRNRLYQQLLAVSPNQWKEWSADDPPLDLWERWIREEHGES